MKVLAAMANMKAGSIALSAGARYVATDFVAGSIAAASNNLVRVCADANPFTRPWRGERLAGKTLLVARALGIGDEFMAARLCAIAKNRFKADRVLWSCYESHHEFWSAAPTPFELLPSIIPWETWQAAGFHVAGERWHEQVALLEQPSAWDIMAAACGIKFRPGEALPFIPAPPAEVTTKTAVFLAPWIGERALILWQLAATSRIRSYPPAETLKAIAKVLEATNACIVAAGHPRQVEDYGITETDRVRTYSGGIPGLIALVAAAAAMRNGAAIVCPDSVLGHIAAAWPKVPVVSLWSAFDPRARVATYPNHRPLFNKIKCSPCWAHETSGDPAKYAGCPHTSCNDHCAGMRTIAPVRIAEAVVAALADQKGTAP